MYLLASVLFQLAQVLKIVAWISLPLLLISLLATIYFHRRRKRKSSGEEILSELPNLVLPMSESVRPVPKIHLPSEDLPDPFGLLNYGRQLEQTRMRNIRLEEELNRLKEQHEDLLAGHLAGTEEKAREWMTDLRKTIRQLELKNTQLQQALDFSKDNQNDIASPNFEERMHEKDQELSRVRDMLENQIREYNLKQEMLDARATEVSKLEQMLKELQASAQMASGETRNIESAWQQRWEESERQHFEEKSRLEEQGKELQESLRKLQEENLSLQEQLVQPRPAEPGSVENEATNALRERVQQLETEKENLQKELGNYHSHHDIAEERRLQLEFVQQQLDQRIRQYHDLELRWRETSEAGRQSTDAIQDLESRNSDLAADLEKLQQELTTLQGEAARRSEEMRDLSLQLEKARQTEQEQLADRNELEKQLRDLGERASDLEVALGNEREKSGTLERKLFHNIDLLKQMYEAVIVSSEKGPASQAGQEKKWAEEGGTP